MLAKNNEYLEETAESLYRANADEIVRQQCLTREDAERRERTLERDNQKLREREQRSILGMVELCKELGLTFEETIEKIAKNIDVNPNEIVQCIKDYWKKE